MGLVLQQCQYVDGVLGQDQVHLFLEHGSIFLQSHGTENVALNLEGICEKLDRKLQPVPSLALDSYAMQKRAQSCHLRCFQLWTKKPLQLLTLLS